MASRVSRPIVYLDSGIGGIPYMVHCHELLREYHYIYVADCEHFPYGAKPGKELRTILTDVVEKIISEYNPQLLVLACNTASVTALTTLRKSYSLPLVGVVPAVKPASLNSERGKIALLVTERTAVEEYLLDLISQFASDRNVHTVVAGGIVSAIERYCNSLSRTLHNRIIEESRTIVEELQNMEIDTLVLGCTHFIYILNYLRSQLDPRIAIIDSRTGISRRVAALLSPGDQYRTHLAPSPLPPELYTTGTSELSDNVAALLHECSIHYAGQL